jgi:transcriptional regulator with XRE-family HTH domain
VATPRVAISKTLHHRETASFRRIAAQLGRRIREQRQDRGWTVEEASERFGIEPAHVRRVEAGRTNPSLATLVSIARGLSLDLTDLFLDPPRRR